MALYLFSHQSRGHQARPLLCHGPPGQLPLAGSEAGHQDHADRLCQTGQQYEVKMNFHRKDLHFLCQ